MWRQCREDFDFSDAGKRFFRTRSGTFVCVCVCCGLERMAGSFGVGRECVY